jgi:hypothetical protein
MESSRIFTPTTFVPDPRPRGTPPILHSRSDLAVNENFGRRLLMLPLYSATARLTKSRAAARVIGRSASRNFTGTKQ